MLQIENKILNIHNCICSINLSHLIFIYWTLLFPNRLFFPLAINETFIYCILYHFIFYFRYWAHKEKCEGYMNSGYHMYKASFSPLISDYLLIAWKLTVYTDIKHIFSIAITSLIFTFDQHQLGCLNYTKLKMHFQNKMLIIFALGHKRCHYIWMRYTSLFPSLLERIIITIKQVICGIARVWQILLFD